MSTRDSAKVEADLIKQCQRGDLTNFGNLYDAYLKQIYNFIYYRVLHKETAEDLTSQTFTKVMQNIGKYNPKKGNFSSWLYRIAKNAVYDHFRSYKKVENIDDIWDLSDNSKIETDVHARMQIEKVKAEMAKLKPEYREIITMRVWDGLSYKEISQIIGKSENNCKVLFKRAIDRIRNNENLILILLFNQIIDL